jgi:hypothetical protein
MQLWRTWCTAGLLISLGLGVLSVSGGCGEAPTGARDELSGQLKKQSVAQGKRMQEYYAAKKAAKKGKAQ